MTEGDGADSDLVSSDPFVVSLLGLLAKTAIASFWWRTLACRGIVFSPAGRILFFFVKIISTFVVVSL